MGLFDMFKGSGGSTSSEPSQKDKSVVDLRKEAKVILEKKFTNPTAQVVLVMDISGSMNGLFRAGAVQVATRQAAALGLEFDDDGVIPVVAFHGKAFNRDPITAGSAEDYFKTLKPGGVGTNYAPALRLAVDQCDAQSTDPIFIIFITDGNCTDASKTTSLIQELSRTRPVFTQFVGIGRERFTYLKKLDDLEGRAIDNAGFCEVRDGVSLTLDDLLNEFPDYVKELQQKRSSGSLSY